MVTLQYRSIIQEIDRSVVKTNFYLQTYLEFEGQQILLKHLPHIQRVVLCPTLILNRLIIRT